MRATAGAGSLSSRLNILSYPGAVHDACAQHAVCVRAGRCTFFAGPHSLPTNFTTRTAVSILAVTMHCPFGYMSVSLVCQSSMIMRPPRHACAPHTPMYASLRGNSCVVCGGVWGGGVSALLPRSRTCISKLPYTDPCRPMEPHFIPVPRARRYQCCQRKTFEAVSTVKLDIISLFYFCTFALACGRGVASASPHMHIMLADWGPAGRPARSLAAGACEREQSCRSAAKQECCIGRFNAID